MNNHKIRKITKDGNVTTIAGDGLIGNTLGAGAVARFNYPKAVAVDSGGIIYVADGNNNRICKISTSCEVSVLAGSGTAGDLDGIGTNAYFDQPVGLAVDAKGTVFVADLYNHKIRKISPNGAVSTLAGSGFSGQDDGIGANAKFYYPIALTLDSLGNIYTVESTFGKIRKISPSGEVTTVAGQYGNLGFKDGNSSIALFRSPMGIALGKDSSIFVADRGNYRIRKLTKACYSISPKLPFGLNFDPMTGRISGKPTSSSNLTQYSVYAVNEGGTFTTTVSIAVAPLGVEGLNLDKLTILPNPFENHIIISGLNTINTLSIYTLTGVKLLSKEVLNGESVDLSSLNSGIYILKIAGQEFKLVKK